MFDFRQVPITFFIPRPLLALMVIGALAILAGVGALCWWVISHLQWVQ